MFELYFGAFDIVLYAAAFITALMLSGGICDALEANEPHVVSTTISPTVMAPALTYVACAPSPKSTAAISVECPATEQFKPLLRVADIRLYKLHQKSVVPISTLPFSIPNTIKRYVLGPMQA